MTLAAGIDGAVRRIATTYNNRGLATKVTSFDNATVGSGSVVNEVERVYNAFNASTYDGLGQVTSANRGVININRTAIGGVPAEGERFVYDPIGNWNRYEKLEDGLGTLDQTRVHNTDNQITQVDAESKDLAYDAAGNMTRTPVGKWCQGATA